MEFKSYSPQDSKLRQFANKTAKVAKQCVSSVIEAFAPVIKILTASILVGAGLTIGAIAVIGWYGRIMGAL